MVHSLSPRCLVAPASREENENDSFLFSMIVFEILLALRLNKNENNIENKKLKW